ncbi:MAG: protein-L-isoaspartate(D-aspartate) O-methyltransferase [Planctomycetes bacterium]|nr:protein-L-isoaspartate(D-aspartate) O-methyltransferase [Planctomycetota bacterium]
MVEEQLVSRDITDQRVIDAFRHVPRHLFITEKHLDSAYDDRPLPIGCGQTISQPYMVAYMLQELFLKGKEKVLEIGTGSGYQTALLAELVREVYTIERLSGLAVGAERILKTFGFSNITFKISDGSIGWKEKSPFDRIIVSAGAPDIPHSLIDQLADKGIMVVPVGDEFSQKLFRVNKNGSEIRAENLTGCVFVKLIGKEGWSDE